MIPKVIHYCWFGGNPKPRQLQEYIDTWKKTNPDFEIREWNESNFDVSSHPFMKAAYDQKAWAFVSDVARLMIVEKHGGIYLDTDVELKKSLEPLLRHQAYFPVSQLDGDVNTGLGFGAEPHAKSVRAMLDIYDRYTFDLEKKMELACPHLNSEALRELGWPGYKQDEIWENEEMCIYPPAYFDPIATGNTKNLMGDETYSVHHYAATWMPAKRRLKRQIANLLGPEVAHTIKKILKKS